MDNTQNALLVIKALIHPFYIYLIYLEVRFNIFLGKYGVYWKDPANRNSFISIVALVLSAPFLEHSLFKSLIWIYEVMLILVFIGHARYRFMHKFKDVETSKSSLRRYLVVLIVEYIVVLLISLGIVKYLGENYFTSIF